jgi:hypothetical protein
MKNYLLYFALLFGVVFSTACTRSANPVDTPNLIPVLGSTQETDLSTQEGNSLPAEKIDSTPTENTGIQNTASPQTYSVVFLADGEILNVRSGPGVTFEIIDSLEANSRKLRRTGKIELVDGILWMEIQLDTGEGWVSGAYLTEEKTAADVCGDPQVGVLLDGLTQAVRDQDGELLSKLVSPIHGLAIHHNLWNPPVTFSNLQDVQLLFLGNDEYDWGFQDGCGEPIFGSFKEIIAPRLEDVLLENHTRHCNTLERGVATGPTTGYVYWPYDYSAFNYIALFRTAPPDQELDWRTWVAGIEYVDGKPYIVVLIQFHWEI